MPTDGSNPSFLMSEFRGTVAEIAARVLVWPQAARRMGWTIPEEELDEDVDQCAVSDLVSRLVQAHAPCVTL